MLRGTNRGKWNKASSHRESNTGHLAWAASAQLRQPDNQQPPQSSTCTECLSCTSGSHSVCAVRTPLGVDRKILSIRKARCPGFNYWWLLAFFTCLWDTWARMWTIKLQTWRSASKASISSLLFSYPKHLKDVYSHSGQLQSGLQWWVTSPV